MAKYPYPLLELTLALYERYITCHGDKLIVMFHFLMIQNGYRVMGTNGQTHETIILTKDNDHSILMEYTKNNRSIQADHNIVGNLYSINMQFRGEQYLGEYFIDQSLHDLNTFFNDATDLINKLNADIQNNQ